MVRENISACLVYVHFVNAPVGLEPSGVIGSTRYALEGRVHLMHGWQVRARPTPRFRRMVYMNKDGTIAQGIGKSQ